VGSYGHSDTCSPHYEHILKTILYHRISNNWSSLKISAADQEEYVRYPCAKLAEHFQCDPATLTENQIRSTSCSWRQHKHYSRSPMKMAKNAGAALLLCV